MKKKRIQSRKKPFPLVKRKPKPPKLGINNAASKDDTEDDFDDDNGFDDQFSSLRQTMKLRRQKFCREYIKDFNGSAAMLRMGSTSKRPWIRASEWLKESYTQYYLNKLTNELDEKTIITRNMVLMGLLREANREGIDATHSARVSALRSLAKILGMEVQVMEGKFAFGGGVLVVPISDNMDDWEKLSQETQALLKQEVRK